MRYILTDIEGTTSSVAFVYETLFPYFKQHIAGFLHQPAAADAKEYLQLAQQTISEEGGQLLSTDEMAQQLISWTNEDRKHPALKAIQGMVWRLAYQNGEIKGHVYPDVPPALARWKESGLSLGVYSSGSVEAQKLLFGHSDIGDLRPYFSHYFDTKVGPKREPTSYQTISDLLQLPAAEILFLSDVEAELDAAAELGMQTIQLLRPGTIAGNKHQTALDFSEI
jgi:enolase-phosphatase E1